MSPANAPVRLLLVADNAETCETIASALLSAPAFYRIERITSDELNRHGCPTDIRLALVDHDLRSAKQSRVVEQLAGEGVAAIALVDSRDVQALQEVVLAGAAALVVVPFEDAQLWETVANVFARGGRPGGAAVPAIGARVAERQGTLIAIYAPKGGSGASVIAANLAVTLQQRASRGAVLVEVGEGTGSQAILLNLRSERSFGDLLARFDPEDTELLNEILAVHESGLRVLLAPPSAGVRVPQDLLEEVLGLLVRLFDYVVVDLHSAAVNSTFVAMGKAHAALVLMTPEMTSLHQVRQFMGTMENSLPDVALNIILNRSTLPTGVPAEAIRQHLKIRLASEIQDEQNLVTQSVNRGIPFVVSHPRSALSRAIRSLASELVPGEREVGASQLKVASPLTVFNALRGKRK